MIPDRLGSNRKLLNFLEHHGASLHSVRRIYTLVAATEPQTFDFVADSLNCKMGGWGVMGDDRGGWGRVCVIVKFLNVF